MKLQLRFANNEYGDAFLNEALEGVLQENILLSMASQNSGASYINVAYYAYNQDMDIYFMSNPESQHAANLEWVSSVALSIADSRQEWDGKKRGLQLFGTCRPARGMEVLHGGRLYLKRFASFGKVITHLDMLLEKSTHTKVFVVNVASLKLLDEERFGPHRSLELTPVRD